MTTAPRTLLTTRWARLNAPPRVTGVDLARGLAVLGMFAAHLLVTAEQWAWSDASTWLSIVDGRSSILFATLAGVSIGLVTGASSPLRGPALHIADGRLAVRAAMLWVIGMLLILTGVPVYVILPAYGILFLLAIPFTGMSAKAVLWTAAALAVIMPLMQPLWPRPGPDLDAILGWHYPFTVWIAFVLAGLGIARAGVTRLRVQVRMLITGAALAAIGYGLGTVFPSPDAPYLQSVWTAAPHSSGVLEAIGSGGFAIAVLGGCLLLCRSGALRVVTLPLRATGAMPLTAYAVQLVAWALVASITLGDPSDLTGFRDLRPFWPMTIAVVVGCTMWALLVGRGPLEWVMDRATRFVLPDRR